VRAEDEIIDHPPPQTHFREFGDSALQLECRGFIHHPAREAAARNALHQRLHRRLREAGIEIPYPQRTLSFEQDVAVPDRDGSSAGERTVPCDSRAGSDEA
jgi:small-conductance mechanosensitive channel